MSEQEREAFEALKGVVEWVAVFLAGNDIAEQARDALRLAAAATPDAATRGDAAAGAAVAPASTKEAQEKD